LNKLRIIDLLEFNITYVQYLYIESREILARLANKF